MGRISEYFSIELTVKDEQIIGEHIIGNFSITNISNHEVALLKWWTPLEDISTNIFNIYFEKEEKVPYEGIMRKRGPKTESDFIVFQPMDEVTVSFDLSENYYLKNPGKYLFLYKPLFKLVFNIERKSFKDWKNESYRSLVGAPIEAQFELKLPLKEKEFAPVQTIKYHSLSLLNTRISRDQIGNIIFGDEFNRNEIEILNSSAETVINLIENSINILTTESDSLLFREWFGNFSRNRFRQVISNFETMYNSITRETYFFQPAFESNCGSHSFAYAFPFSETIFFCNYFWITENEEFDTKPGVIIHELSHCSFGANDDQEGDNYYSAKILASNNPDRAVENANNYEYFSEATNLLIL